MVRELLQANTLRKRTLLTLAVLLVFGAGLYGFFVKETVAYVVERRQVEKEVSILQSGISEKEAVYIALVEGITMKEAEARGFGDTEGAYFVSRTPDASRVTLHLE